MRTLQLVFALMLAVLGTASCAAISGGGGSYLPKHSGLFPIRQNGKYGYIDSSGKVVINPQFGDCAEFFDGMARVLVGDKIGFIDTSGKVVINPQFADASRFSEGLAFVHVGEKVGVIDKTGKFVVNPQFDTYRPIDLAIFSDGLAPVRVGEKVGYIDTTGKLVVNPQFLAGNSFSEGLAHVMIGDRDGEGYVKDNSKCGYIDKTEKFAINPQFANCNDFVGGLAVVGQGTKDSYRSVAIDKTGAVVIKSDTQQVSGVFSDGLIASCQKPYGEKRNCVFVDRTGNVTTVQYCCFDDAFSFSEGLAAVTKDDDSFGGRGKSGYIDTKGKMVINYQFYNAGTFWGGLAKVLPDNSSSNKYGYIDRTGKFVWNPSE